MKRPGHKYVLFLIDGLLINASFYCATLVHGLLTGERWFHDPASLLPELLFWAVCAAVTMFVFITGDLYKIDVYLSVTRQVFSIVRSASVALAAIAVVAYFGKSAAFTTSKVVLLSFYLLTVVSLSAGRLLLFRAAFNLCCRRGVLHRNVLVLGAGAVGRHMAEVLGAGNPFGLRLVGVLDDSAATGTSLPGGVSVLGRTADVRAVVERRDVDEVIVCPDHERDEKLLAIVGSCTRTRARVLVGCPDFRVVPDYTPQERYDGVPMFGMRNSRGYLGLPVLKRITDTALAAAGLIVLSPVLAGIALAVRLDSAGPVLHRQTRIGRNGAPFTFYKFRSMRPGSDDDPERVRKLEEFIRDPGTPSGGSTKIVDQGRVTRIGRFLRKSSLDELPQLFNVVRGEMSLVGPRPCLPYEWERYSAWQKQRLSVTPGCTGLWQVTARSRVGFRDMAVLDIFYANNVSFHFDLWIILKTIPVMFFGTGGR